MTLCGLLQQEHLLKCHYRLSNRPWYLAWCLSFETNFYVLRERDFVPPKVYLHEHSSQAGRRKRSNNLERERDVSKMAHEQAKKARARVTRDSISCFVTPPSPLQLQRHAYTVRLLLGSRSERDMTLGTMQRHNSSLRACLG